MMHLILHLYFSLYKFVYCSTDVENPVYRGIVVCNTDGSRAWVPDVVEKPFKGLQFVSLEHAFNFYKEYGRKGGFDVRRGGQYKKNSVSHPTIKYFVCNREGHKHEAKEERNKENGRKRASFRTGCCARIGIKLVNGLFEIHKFYERHNHALVGKQNMEFMKSSRNLGFMKQLFLYQISRENVGSVRGFKLLKEICGGYSKVGALVADSKNNRRDMNLFIGDRDAQMVVEKLLSRKHLYPGFTCEYMLTGDRLSGLFWADAESKSNYKVFGDVVSFDATYRSNRYDFDILRCILNFTLMQFSLNLCCFLK